MHVDIGKGLFGSRRYDDQGRERPEFILNREPFRKAQFLIGGENFGCGSSLRDRRLGAEEVRDSLRPSGSNLTFESWKGFPSGSLHASLAHANRNFHYSQAC